MMSWFAFKAQLWLKNPYRCVKTEKESERKRPQKNTVLAGHQHPSHYETGETEA